MSFRRWLAMIGIVGLPALLAFGAITGVLYVRQGGGAPFDVPATGTAPTTSPAMIARGRYLATLGNCVGCHTARGGAPLAGGRAFATSYGTVYSSNITRDATHGIGDWSREEFRHAMRHGVSRRGVLSPVFPYASFRHLVDDDLDAILAYLRDAPPSSAPRRAPAYEFPANLPGALTAWRLLYVRPALPAHDVDPVVARGAYLVEGIGHCATCHGARGAFASQAEGRALLGARNAGWHAPALDARALARFDDGDVARYLQGDTPDDIGTYGLMADVVAGNLQHLRDDDARAIEAYLRALPPPPARPDAPPSARLTDETLALGRDVYRDHCADCHGATGEGEPGRYPSLRGSSAITSDDPVNLVKLVLFGAVAPSTARQPLPYTMPPAAQSLGTREVAALVNLLRRQENPSAAPVTDDDITALGGIAWH